MTTSKCTSKAEPHAAPLPYPLEIYPMSDLLVTGYSGDEVAKEEVPKPETQFQEPSKANEPGLGVVGLVLGQGIAANTRSVLKLSNYPGAVAPPRGSTRSLTKVSSQQDKTWFSACRETFRLVRTKLQRVVRMGA